MILLWPRGCRSSCGARLPDEQLLQLASAGKLHEPAVLGQQVRRMLADARSRALVSNFANQWLNVENLDNVDPDPVLFPNFDEDLRRAFRREMELFADSVLRNDRNVTEPADRQVHFPERAPGAALRCAQRPRRPVPARRPEGLPMRWGLLGKGAMLMSTSYGNRTAPVLRGNWILERVTGTPPAAPPPGVEALKENQPGQKATTVRERLETAPPEAFLQRLPWRDGPARLCAGELRCDRALARPGPRGADSIDSTAVASGTPVQGLDDLRACAAARPEQFAQSLTRS